MKIASIQTSNAYIPVSNRKERGNTLLLAIVGSACLVPHLQTLCLNLVDSFCIIPLRYDLSFPSTQGNFSFRFSASHSLISATLIRMLLPRLFSQPVALTMTPLSLHPFLGSPFSVGSNHKLLVFAFKALQSLSPSYLSSLSHYRNVDSCLQSVHNGCPHHPPCQIFLPKAMQPRSKPF